MTGLPTIVVEIVQKHSPRLPQPVETKVIVVAPPLVVATPDVMAALKAALRLATVLARCDATLSTAHFSLARLAATRHADVCAAVAFDTLLAEDPTARVGAAEAAVAMREFELRERLAAGEPLGLAQTDVTQRGHAIEVRLYAEDCARDFMPSPGTLTQFSLPQLPHLRCENGYQSGSTVSASYDPMIAKLAAWGATRDEAIARMLNALGKTTISGLTNNCAFLARVLAHPEFAAGKTSTDFIPKHKDALFSTERMDDETAALAAAYLLFGAAVPQLASVSQAEHSAWNNPKLAGMR